MKTFKELKENLLLTEDNDREYSPLLKKLKGLGEYGKDGSTTYVIVNKDDKEYALFLWHPEKIAGKTVSGWVFNSLEIDGKPTLDQSGKKIMNQLAQGRRPVDIMKIWNSMGADLKKKNLNDFKKAVNMVL